MKKDFKTIKNLILLIASALTLVAVTFAWYSISKNVGGFTIDSNLPRDYEFKITAKDSLGREINISDAGTLGAYIECGSVSEVNLVISIVKTDIPWGLFSLWESLAR